MAEKPTPPWAAEIPEGAFISSAPTYPLGRYLERFHKDYFTASDGTKLKYYFFDPTEYGWPAKKDYPILIFFHGTSNSFVDDVCVNYTGAEMYASDEYQKAMGGAYILVPVANEYRDENGRVQGYWSAPYIESAHELVTSVIASRTNGVGTRFSFGNSSGARFVFRLADAHPEGYDALIPVGTADISSEEHIAEFAARDMYLLYSECKRDEFYKFDEDVVPKLPRLAAMKHCVIFTPDWVYNGDGGIASIFAGVEMGQHCLMNAVQSNLMFDNGTPMYPDVLPNGVTGWIADVVAERRDVK